MTALTLTPGPAPAELTATAGAKANVFELATQLAEATRCRILLLLEQSELAVSEICTALRLPQSTVSRHLKVLADGGWLLARREGTSQLYRPASTAGPATGLWQLFRAQLADSPETRQDRLRLDAVLEARRARSQEFSRAPRSTGTACATSFSAAASTSSWPPA